ncbi:MAG: peptidoglycan editing factor PgeF [Candidatus Omnitrophica bacterium]|nr:peptidoglycan editing factor PgeF [Candidatus Omnitrophota bacterium]
MEIVQSRRLNSIPRLKHGFFLPGEERSLEDNLSFKSAPRETVMEARRRACGFLEIPHENLTHVYQEHGTGIWPVEQEHCGAGALTGDDQVGRGDALITQEENLPLAILIADCLPIFFSTSDAGVIGLAHAGWRGTFDEIAVKTVQRMHSEFAVDARDLNVWIGPGISVEGFTVGDDLWEKFKDRWGGYSDCFRDATTSIDLKQLNRIQLEGAGVPPGSIETSGDCTFCDRRFFSYRRDGKGSGHNMAVIMRDGR